MQKVYAVVVTYNRLALLQQVIPALKNQTEQLHRIIVVNNCSSDGTANWLDQQHDLKVIHQGNEGGAGGFYAGVKAALEDGARWIWMVDDDVLPRNDCLQHLLACSSFSECIHPVHFDADNNLQDEERWFDPVNCQIISHFNSSFTNGKKTWVRNMGSFEGMLISRRVVDLIGMPDKRFFLMHDDLVYGLLAHQHTNVLVTADAVMNKLLVRKSPESIYAGLYYQFRNLWLLEEYCDRLAKGFTAYRKRRVRLQFYYEVYKIIRGKEFPDKRRALKVLYKAYRDYKRKKSGRTIV